MSRDSQIGQGLLTLSRGFGKTGSSQSKQHELIHMLSIETGTLSATARGAFRFTYDEELSWMTSAAERGRSLLILRTTNSIELYTTDQDRFVALRPAIEALAARVGNMPELGKTNTLQLSGAEAARHLFCHAAQVEPLTAGVPSSASSIQRAAALSAAATALGPTLASLFRAAANVGRRVRQETLLDDSSASQALREVEAFAAERIVEEELATWQAQEAEIQRATGDQPVIMKPGRAQFETSEPVSEVRLRIGTTIRPSISYLLEPKSISS